MMKTTFILFTAILVMSSTGALATNLENLIPGAGKAEYLALKMKNEEIMADKNDYTASNQDLKNKIQKFIQGLSEQYSKLDNNKKAVAKIDYDNFIKEYASIDSECGQIGSRMCKESLIYTERAMNRLQNKLGVSPQQRGAEMAATIASRIKKPVNSVSSGGAAAAANKLGNVGKKK